MGEMVRHFQFLGVTQQILLVTISTLGTVVDLKSLLPFYCTQVILQGQHPVMMIVHNHSLDAVQIQIELFEAFLD